MIDYSWQRLKWALPLMAIGAVLGVGAGVYALGKPLKSKVGAGAIGAVAGISTGWLMSPIPKTEMPPAPRQLYKDEIVA